KAIPRRPLRTSKSSNDIGDRVVAEDAACSRLGSHIRTAHAVDEVCSAIVKHAAGDVVYLNIRISRRLGSPAVSGRIVLERMSKLVACRIGATPAHGIKLPVAREKCPSKASPHTRQVCTGPPTATAWSWRWRCRWCWRWGGCTTAAYEVET